MGKVRNILQEKNSSTIYVSLNTTVFEALELMFKKTSDRLWLWLWIIIFLYQKITIVSASL